MRFLSIGFIVNAMLCCLLDVFLFALLVPDSLSAFEAGDETNAVASSNSAASPNYYCGLYCVFASAKRLGVDVDFENLLQPKYLSGNPGSTIEDLRTLIEDIGLKSEVVSNLSLQNLSQYDGPAIIHTRAGASRTEFSHWMLFAGIDSAGQYRVYDPPFTNGALGGAELQSLWNGTAILVYPRDDGRWLQRLVLQGIPSSNVVLTIAVAFICFLFMTRFFAASPTLGIALTTGLACVCTQIPADSFARNWPVVRRQSYFDKRELQRIPLSKIERLGDVTFVDARTELQFATSHIKNAQSLPLGSGILRTKQFVDLQPDVRPIVVYCDNQECTWAETVASELIRMGQMDVYVLDEGFQGWKRSHENR